MKVLVLLAAVTTVGLSGGAFAQISCHGTALTDIATELGDKTVCVGSSPSFEAQEYHRSSDHLIIDYKRGPGHAVDPSKEIGSWLTTSPNKITYKYTDGPTFSYTVFKESDGSSYYFCNGTNLIVTATLKSGSNGCK